MSTGSGVKVVLTASITEMSDYFNNPFVAFVAGFGKGPVPSWFLRKTLYPPVERNDDRRAKYAPYGLRKVEAFLLESGFSESDVAVVHPVDLGAFVGSDTKVIGISSMDPTGMGYVSKTYSSLLGGGESMNAIEFRRLIKHRSIRMFRPKIVVGGFGSWQLERKQVADGYNIDCVLVGEKRETIVDIFRKAVNDESLPKIIHDENNGCDTESEDMPLIRHAAIHGAVEISKGCGRNCQFCTPTMQRKTDIPVDRIMEEVKITMMEGGSNITLVTEDLFLYGAKGKQFTPNKNMVVKLVRSVADHPDVKGIQPSHISLAPVVNDPRMVREVAEILIEHNWYFHDKKPIVTSETGIETGSIRLMKKYMAHKMLPYKPEQWREIITQAFGILNDCNWYPLATLIIGLPQETEEDVTETLELIDHLKDYNAFYVPLFFVPLENSLLKYKKGAEVNSLTEKRWELLIRCWEYNIRIWRDTFLEQRISNPLIFNATKKLLIPYIARMISIYYGMRHGQQMKQALWKMATT